jgi:diguanylate cyclase (GGDEF)-like protein
MIDLDNFKQINDTLGHIAGDSILCEVAGRILENITKSDLSCRYGGDEFTILLVRDGHEDFRATVASLFKSILAKPVLVEHKEIPFSISMGMAKSDNNSGLDALLRQADQALYSAKQSGRNRWKIWELPIAISEPI